MYRGLPTHKVCVLPAFQVLLEARRGQMDPLRLELWMDGCEPPGGCWGSNFTTHWASPVVLSGLVLKNLLFTSPIFLV